MISFRALESCGASGTRGDKVGRSLRDHCERIVRACQAAGVEKARGLAASIRLAREKCRVASSICPRYTKKRRKAMSKEESKRGKKRSSNQGDERMRNTNGNRTDSTPTEMTAGALKNLDCIDVGRRPCQLARLDALARDRHDILYYF